MGQVSQSFVLLLGLVVCGQVKSQLSVFWNGTIITGTALIYHDEVFSSSTVPELSPLIDPGSYALFCRSESSSDIAWHTPNGAVVNSSNTEFFYQVKTATGVVPSESGLVRSHDNSSVISHNGLFTCRLNGSTQGAFPIGLYSRGRGYGRIVSNQVSLSSSTFLTDSPTFTLVGNTNGGPPTTSFWRRDGGVIINGGAFNIFLSLNESSPRRFISSLYVSTLTVTGRYPGVYEYTVINKATAAMFRDYFTVEGGGTVNGLMAEQTAPTEVKITWTAPSIPPSRGYQITVASASINDTVSGTSHTVTIFQLGVHAIQVQPLSQHYPSEAVSVEVTVRGALRPVVSISSRTATSVTISWTQPQFSLPVDQYTVSLKRVTGSGQVLCPNIDDQRPLVTTNDTSTSFTGLEEFSVYLVTVTTTFNIFRALLFTTLSHAPTASPLNVTPTTTSRSVMVTWDAIECIERNGIITGYLVEFQEQGGARIPGEVVDQSFTASGLNPAKNYTFQVAGVNNDGTGVFTSLAISTDEDTPGPVSTLMAQSRLTSIVLTWSAPQEPNGVIISYEVTYRVADGDLVTTNTTDLSITFTIPSLTPQTRVSSISVSAYTRIGQGEVTRLPDLTTFDRPYTHPTIRESPTSIAAGLASAVNLTCTAEGFPPPSYQWYKDGAVIPGEVKTYLYIEEVQLEDRGNYTCVAVSPGGREESQPARLTIPGIYQYAVDTTISRNDTNAVQNLLETISSSRSQDTQFTIHSTQVLCQACPAQNVTFLVTVLELGPGTSVSDRKRFLFSHLNALHVQFQSIDRFDGCDSELFEGSEWPETELGECASTECLCAEFLDALAGRALRFCEGDYRSGAQWREHIDTSMCAVSMSDVTRLLCEAAASTQNSTREVARVVVNVTSNPETLTAADVSATSVVVESLTEQAISDPEVQNEYLKIINNIQQADPEVVYNSQIVTRSSQRILNNLAQFLDMVDLIISDNSSKAVFGFDTYALLLQDIDPSFFNGQTFTVNLGSVEDAMEFNGDIRESLVTSEVAMKMLGNFTASVELPSDLLDSICASDTLNSELRLSYSVFLTDILFQSPQTQNETDIGSIIVAVRLGCAENASSFSPLIVTLRTVQQLNNTAVENGSCAVWDKDFGIWSTSGCRKVTDVWNNTVCECQQLGHFGILFDLSPGGFMDPHVALALFVITYIGISVSLLCLALLTCTYLSSKKLRSETHTQIILNMGLSLAGLYIFFLIGGHVTSVAVLCGFSAAFLHYFMLVFFAWTAAEATWLYIKLVKVLGTQSAENLYILKAGISAWAIPLLIVVLSAGSGSKYYISDYYCRATEWPFWFGFITPFLLLYIFDWIMFAIIITSILKRRHGRIKMQSQSKTKLHRENLNIALSLAVMFGLGWGFGLLATSYPVEEVTITFQVLFSLFVGAQGALLFLLHGVRNADARKVWKDWASSFSTAATRLHSTVSSSMKRSVTVTQNSAKMSQNSALLPLAVLPELDCSDPQAGEVLASCSPSEN